MSAPTPVRVLMVIRPAVGGMKEQMLALSRGLLERGYEVEVAGPGGSDVLLAAAEAGFATHDVPLVGPLHPLHDPRAMLALARIVRRGRFDVVHAHGFKAGFVGRLGGWLGHAPAIVVTAHNHVMYRDDISALTKWRYRAVERLLAPLTSRIVTVSDSLRDELVEAYCLPAEKIVTVHNGVDVAALLVPHDRASARAALGLPPDAPIAGTACRFAPQKGLRHLLDALPRVRELVPGALLVLGGDGPLAGELRDAARALGVDDAVVWPGMVADMPRFLAALDVYASSSLSEGLPLTLIEVAAAGVPTVATRAGGTPEVVLANETGLLVEPADGPALAEAIAALLLDPDRGARLAEVARARALAEFAPERMVERTAEVYSAALGRASA